jgi:arylsulfatase A-like enzyme
MSPSARRWSIRVASGALVVLAIALAYSAEHVEPPPSAPPPAIDAAVEAPDAPIIHISRPPRRDARPDILLFTVEALRADHVSAYRYDRDTTPALRALAERGTRFDRAYSVSSWTLPAIASLLTGVLPSEHGVLHSDLLPDHDVLQDHLSASLPSLPAALHDAGYRTIGVTANGHLVPAGGFTRGFDDYECLGFADADAVRSAMSTRLEELRESETPYFLWVHVADPHAPYTPTEPWFSTWWPASSERFPILANALVGEAVGPMILREHLPPREAIAFVRAAYDSEVRRDDEYLARLLAELDDGHLVVVATSDHGEELGDHLAFGHGHTLFEEVVHVPLVIAVPEQTPSIAATSLVSILDVFPTLMHIAEIEPPARLTGTSLAPALSGMELASSRDIVMETGRRDQVVEGIFDGRYIYAERLAPTRAEGLFDVENDPSEVHDLFGAHPEIVQPLRDRLHAAIEAAVARRTEVPVRDTLPLSSMLHEQLGALGYGQ